MPTNQELQTQLDRAMAELAARERRDAESKAAARLAELASAEAKAADECAKSAAQERNAIRRGAYANYLLSQMPPNEPVDFAAIDAGIPKDEEKWPPGVDPASFVLTGGARIRPEHTEIQNTTLGKLLLSMSPK